MTSVKRMTATQDFLKMQKGDRGCQVELYETCRTTKLLEKCKCVPWEMPRDQLSRSLKMIHCVLSQNEIVCSPTGRACIEEVGQGEVFKCSVNCEGTYNADMQWLRLSASELIETVDQEWMGKLKTGWK